jgi:hypothetical protein
MISGTPIVLQKPKMETEQPCPFCKRIHYSIYTVERCVARHQVSSELSSYLNEEREKRKKPAPPQIGSEKVVTLFD